MSTGTNYTLGCGDEEIPGCGAGAVVGFNRLRLWPPAEPPELALAVGVGVWTKVIVVGLPVGGAVVGDAVVGLAVGLAVSMPTEPDPELDPEPALGLAVGAAVRVGHEHPHVMFGFMARIRSQS